MTDCIKIKIEDLIDNLVKSKLDKTPVIIAIDGPSGGGKSYFAKKLSHMLAGSFIVEMDYFISWNGLDLGVDRAINQLFEPIVKNGKARFQGRDWTGDYFGDSLGDWKEVPKHAYFILEGIASSRLEYSPYLNTVIWVEAPEELCMQRGLERDGPHLLEHWRKFKKLEKHFFEKDNTKLRVDYVVNSVNNEIYKMLPTARF